MRDGITSTDIKSYLEKHGVSEYKEKGNEIAFPCPFNGCDDDHRGSEEYHCNINTTNGTLYCFKCGEKGNFITLQKHFGDYEKPKRQTQRKKSLHEMAKECHGKLPEQYKTYFNNRGITNESIDKFLLGYGEFYGKFWLTIPVFSDATTVSYLKLRQLPDDSSNNTKYIVYPRSSKIAIAGLYELQQSSSNDVLICEGELDRIVALQNGVSIPIITCGGAMTFKEAWAGLYLKHMRNIYVCLDLDETGKKATGRLTEIIKKTVPNASIYDVKLPDELGDGGDISDYFKEHPNDGGSLTEKYAEHVGGVKPIDITKQQEMSIHDVGAVLNYEIKHDFVNKVITFLAMLLTYTKDNQLNIVFNAASATGKTYICSKVAEFFPKNDVKIYGKTTPTAFYYNKSLAKTDEDTGETYIDLERKILIFTEQPDTRLLENLRAFLSHDNKKTPFAITNKEKGANTAKEGYILGFSSTFFCTANMRMDEQEQTRALILSPEVDVAKIEAGIDHRLIQQANEDVYREVMDTSTKRLTLMDRVYYIKQQDVKQIKLHDYPYVKSKFMESIRSLQARNQRDIGHFISLIKAVALLNVMFRKDECGYIVATNADVDQAYELWSALDESRQYGIPPQLFNIYKELIVPAYIEKNSGTNDKDYWKGLTFKEFTQFHFNKTSSTPNIDMYKRTYIPLLEGASLINYAKPEDGDKRNYVITPLVLFDDDAVDEAEVEAEDEDPNVIPF